MHYKSIFNAAVAVAAAGAAVFFIGCSEKPDEDEGGNSGGGGGKGNDISKYRTEKIGTQTWMAENLDNAISGSVCYDNNSSNCDKYGRLYDWNTAVMACPLGWHLPSDAEWTILTDFVGGGTTRVTAGRKLKSSVGWNDNGNGTDDYGFSALPGGYGLNGGIFNHIGDYGFWWSATEYNVAHVPLDVAHEIHRLETKKEDGNHKGYLFSVRCVQD